MDWNKIDKTITNSPRYIVFKKHERLLIFIEGLIVIGLLFGIVMFFLQDREMKSQIRDKCGYSTDNYECVCDAQFVSNWKDIKSGDAFKFNISLEPDG